MSKARTTITITEELLTKVKYRAVFENTNVSNIFSKAVLEYLENRDKEFKSKLKDNK